MKIHLISYGDAKYASQREFFRETAVASSFFDEITIFTPEDIEDRFAEKVNRVLFQPRGGGYWIWKPYFIKKTLENVKNGDILIYCDAGCMINGVGRTRFNQYLEMLANSETGTIDFELPFKEYQYTKQDVFDYFKASDLIVHSNQLMATVLMFRKCEHTSRLIDTWYKTACDQSSLFTDEMIRRPVNNGFIDHRHDQSIFSVIRKQAGANIIPDETYFLDFVREGRDFPIWAARLR